MRATRVGCSHVAIFWCCTDWIGLRDQSNVQTMSHVPPTFTGGHDRTAEAMPVTVSPTPNPRNGTSIKTVQATTAISRCRIRSSYSLHRLPSATFTLVPFVYDKFKIH